ncbi:hypothetical protein BY996DRAFT_6420972 [Phakopsora pachyrhizi]|nr:hypothetical protein BY996DRAFT_6420972 [Phakopsora pachyrhizi]
MVPGTGFSGSENYAKSPYADKLPGLGFAYCWISLPGYSTVDLQISGELVAYAIKSLAADSGRSISILTYSQGGSNRQFTNNNLTFGRNNPRTFQAFWPSLRPLVASFVAMAPPMRGSAAADVLCMASVVIGGCVPALLQESMLSNYMRAINSGEGAYALASSTVIYTMMDEIVIPQVPQSASTLEGASNILIQDICGYSHAVDHFTMPSDMGVYGVVIDALVSGRPVNPSTVDRKTLRYSAVGLASDLKAVYRSLVGNLPQRTRMILKTFTTLVGVLLYNFIFGNPCITC